jgi:hypothetical protein
MANITGATQTQLLEIIAVLMKNFTVPGQGNSAESGFHIANSNQFSIFDNAYNQNLANNLTCTSDGFNLYVTLVTGNPSSGY